MNLRIFVVAGGIFGFYFIFGILQERIFRGTYGEDGEKFVYVTSLLLIQTAVNYIYTRILRIYNPTTSEDKTHIKYQLSIALTYVLAMIASFMSLQHVNYPTQVIAKSGKPIPVLIMGAVIGNKSFPIRKYFIVFLIVFGVALFLYKDGKSSDVNEGMGIGELLLGTSLLMDGLTNSLQERVIALYNPESNQLMGSINKWTVVFLSFLVTFNGEIFKFFSFVQRHPSVIKDIITMSITSALGQYFIFKCVCEFGTLMCSIVTTTRKFFTVLASILIFGNSLIPRQWVAVVCVFSGLFLDSYFGKAVKKQK